MKRFTLLLVFVHFLFHSSLAAPRLSVADAPDDIECKTHAQPPFIALVDVLGVDPSLVAVHAAIGNCAALPRFNSSNFYVFTSSGFRWVLPSHTVIHCSCARS
jgi:hypothetical protein